MCLSLAGVNRLDQGMTVVVIIIIIITTEDQLFSALGRAIHFVHYSHLRQGQTERAIKLIADTEITTYEL